MKRKIALLIIAVMMISLSSCESVTKNNDLPGTLDNDTETTEHAEQENSEKESTANVDDTEEADL